MDMSFFSSHKAPEQSFSRQLDDRVEQQEMPYGYSDLNEVPGHDVYVEKKFQNKMKGKK